MPADESAVVLQALNAAMEAQERDAQSSDVTAVMLIRLSSVDTRCSVLAYRCQTRSSLPRPDPAFLRALTIMVHTKHKI